MSTIALYGGGFKFPTKGHFSVVKEALQEYPEIDELIIMVGQGIRDGVTQRQSVLIWEIYKKHLPKVSIEPVSSPIGDIMGFAKNHPEDEIYFILGVREGVEGDQKDNENRTKSIEEKYPNLKPKIITTGDGSMSGTNARKAIKTGKINDYFPDELSPEDKKEVFNILSTQLNENATYSKYIDYRQDIKDLTKHMLSKGMNIEPLPKLIFMHGDSVNAQKLLGKTAYYEPDIQTIYIFTEGRHPKDILKSFTHEMTHHTQNLEGRLDNISTTNTNEDDNLNKLEGEAYLDGNINFRNWTDSLQENHSLNEGKQVGTLYHYTSKKGVDGILKSNKLKTSEDYYLNQENYYISFTRNKNFHNNKTNWGIGSWDYRIAIDGDKLSNKYKIHPFAYTPGWEYENNYDYDWLDDETEEVRRDFFNTTGEYDEYEERIAFPKEGYIDNIKDYIIKVDKIEDLKENLNEYGNVGPSIPKVYIVKDDGTYKEAPIELLSKISNLTYDMGGGETNYYSEKNIVIVDNIPVEEFIENPNYSEIKGEKIYVEYNLNQPYSFPKANKIIAAQIVYHLDDIKSFAKTINDSLKGKGTFQFFSDLMNKQDKEFLNYLSSEYGFGLPKNLKPYKSTNLNLKKEEFVEPVISYIYKITDKDGKTATLSVTKKGNSWEWEKIDGDIDFKTGRFSVPPENPNPDYNAKKYTLRTFDSYLEYFGDSNPIVDFEKLNEEVTLDSIDRPNEIKYWALYYDLFKELKNHPENYPKMKNFYDGEFLQALEYFWDLLEQGELNEKEKDIFGLNQYARELIKEGIYDSIVTQLSNETLKHWKSDFESNKAESILEDDYHLTDSKGRPLEFEYIATLKIQDIPKPIYKVDGGSDGGKVGKEIGYIVVDFIVDKKDLPQMWSNISMDLADVLRHEIEHLTQEGHNLGKGKYVDPEFDLRDLINTKILPFKYYFLLKSEIDPMLKGMHLKAKKSKKPFKDIVDEYLEKMGLKPEEKEEVLKVWREKTKKLSLPPL